ncbi:hypothetical protein ACIRPT_06960 [Streptomyces sp. NPDC101227]|uniref:hypothetical protein n=1 Tax=Streptomyces sp. NPDC101227 TaxID=3366136 RepID=UPI003819889C
MGSPQLTLCAAVAACVVTTASAYAADDRGAGTATVSVTPAAAAPDTAVTLHLAGCDAARATAESSVFAGTVPLARSAEEDGHALAGSARIRREAAPGTYPVTVTCPAAAGRAAAGRASSGALVTGTVRVAMAASHRPVPADDGAGGDHRAPRATPSEQADANRELSSTSAVGLVLAGGALLVVAGQLLRLRLRLRREREGGGSGDAN